MTRVVNPLQMSYVITTHAQWTFWGTLVANVDNKNCQINLLGQEGVWGQLPPCPILDMCLSERSVEIKFNFRAR